MKTAFSLRSIAMVLSVLAMVGCAVDPPAECRSGSVATAASAAEVCANLRAINCPIADCEAAYGQWRVMVDSASFARVTQCYRSARTCREVDDCSRACGTAGGPVR